MSNKNLFTNFEPVSKAEWLAKVEKDLKGKSLDSLNWALSDSIQMDPFFHKEDLKETNEPITAGRQNNSWEIGEITTVKDEKAAQQQAIQGLEGGITALCFASDSAFEETDFGSLLKDIQHEWITTHFLLEGSYEQLNLLIEKFIKALNSKNQDANNCKGSIYVDPVGGDLEVNFEKLSNFLKSSKKALPQFRTLTVCGHATYKGVENTPNELANIILKGNTYLDGLTDHKWSVNEINNTLQFSLLIGENYFLNIAKIRALRLLWENVLLAYDEKADTSCEIEVHLAPDTQSEDANYNMIKTTTQAMSALIAGTNRLYLLPSDAFENPNGSSFSRRIARNVQHLLKMESYFDRVVDPSAGSYFIETLTNTLAEEAWKIFQSKA